MNSNPDNMIADQLRATPRGYKVRSAWMRSIVTFLMVSGPGLIVMEADNDAGAVSTYTQAGGQYGLSLLWVMLLLPPERNPYNVLQRSSPGNDSYLPIERLGFQRSARLEARP
jgi:hypothetical protein